MAEETDAALINPVEAATDEEFEDLWIRVMTEPRRRGAILTLRERGCPDLAPPAVRSSTTGHVTKATARARTRPPKVGTIIQRSSATNARKLEGLLAEPPRPPPRPRTTARKPPTSRGQKEILQNLFGDLTDLTDDETPTAPRRPPTPMSASATSTSQEHRAEPTSSTATSPPEVCGPVGPPPVRVAVGGVNIDVPYFSAVVTRKFRACVGNVCCGSTGRGSVYSSANYKCDRSSSLPSAGVM